jgi:hypothetical protein
MTEFRAAYLPKDWEEDTRSDVLAMSQGAGTFWDFAVSIQSRNALLAGTASHLTKEKLRHQLEANMSKKLSAKCRSKKGERHRRFSGLAPRGEGC